MAQARFISSGRIISITNSSGATIIAKSVVAVGNFIGIAAADIPDGGTGVISLTGVYEIAAKDTDVISIGAKVYWDAANSYITLTQGTNAYAGIALSVKSLGVTVVRVLLNNGVALPEASTTKAGIVEIATLAEALARENAALALSPSSLPENHYVASTDTLIDDYGKNGDVAFVYSAGSTTAIYEKISGHWVAKVAAQAFTPAG